MGIRPMFYGYSKKEHQICFASEAKALFDLCDDIMPFPPGHYYLDGQFVCYNDLSDPKTIVDDDLETIAGKLKTKLEKAVEKRFMSDAPIGYLLSGGLDSSLVCAIGQKLSDKPIRTFAIGMESDPIDLKYAKQVADYLGTEHTEVIMNKEDLYQHLKEVIYHLETFDITTIRASMAMYILCKYIHQNTDIKVIMTGEVSDELFGYKYTDFAPNAKAFQEEASKRIYATTDSSKGALRKLADEEGYETFIIPDDVGGRFSVLTPVGLLPIACAGLDIDAMMQGAADACEEFKSSDLKNNDSYQYAVVRNVLHRKGKDIELLVNYEPQLHYVGEWWKQLYGESEGKDNKGIFPAAVDFSTDLHSMGQYIQEGKRILFETVLNVENAKREITIDEVDVDLDGLNYLAGKTVDFVNKKAFQGTLLAHTDGNVPNLIVNIPKLDEYNFGYLVYFFEKACALSGYILGVNPFDQPGVEAYKKNMFALLGKPGFEKEKEELEKRL